jgi:regulator of replication initiation timing
MKKIIYLTEQDLYKITQRVIEESEIEEGIFDGISNITQGLKGVWRGEGYDFFKYLNSLKMMVKDLKKLDLPNKKIMTKLTDLKNKITTSKMPPEKRSQLISEIEKALEKFNEYSQHIDNIEMFTTKRLEGED